MFSLFKKKTVQKEPQPTQTSRTPLRRIANSREPLTIRDEQTYQKIVDITIITRADVAVEKDLFSLLSSKLYGATKEFFYSKDYDTQGILYYLGTNRGLEEYHNPHLRGVVTASASSFQNSTIDQFVDRMENARSRLYTDDIPKQYFMVDFHNVMVQPTHYTLSHDGSDNVPINWSVLGSTDGVTWTLLKCHSKDMSLCSERSHTWPITADDYYSKFKFLHADKNESDLWYFIIDRLEMYGKTINLI
jgi:E3 ubiquitin-protein ligase HECTD1